MKPWKTILALACAAFILAGSTALGADPDPGTYQTRNNFVSGDWDDKTTWDVWDGDSWGPAKGYPEAGDTATIRSGDTVTLDADAEVKVLSVAGTLNTSSQTLTVSQSGADLNITGNSVVNIDDNGMVLITGGGTGHSIETNARLNLLASGSVLRITTNSPVTIAGSGAIVGSDDAASIEIGHQSGGSTPVVFTSTTTIRGHLVISDVSGESGSFTNQGTVEADVNGGVLLVSADTVDDSAGADRWKSTVAGAELDFSADIGSFGPMEGEFHIIAGEIEVNKALATTGRLDIDAGTLDVNQNLTMGQDGVSPNHLDKTGGTIDVAAGMTFTHN